MGLLWQFFTAFASSWGPFVMGLLNCWPSYTLDLYKHPNTTLLSAPMTEVEGSLVSSLPSLGAMVGSAYCGALIDKIGRQKGGVVNSLFFVLSWAMVYLSTNSIIIIIARFLMGISGGAFILYAPIFISEVSDDRVRGFLASGPVLFFCIGSVVSYIIGWLFSFHVIVMLNLASSVLACIFCFLVVESPIYLVRQGRDQDARQAIAKYKSVSPDSKIALQELSRIKAQVNPAVELVSLKDDTEKAEEAEKHKEDNEKQDLEDDNATPAKKMSAIKLLFVSPSSRRAFTVVGIHLTLQVFMGMVPVMVFAKTLFAQTVPAISPHLCSVILGVMVTSGAIISSIITELAGRKVLLIVSSILVGVSMFALGLQLQYSLGPGWIAAVIILAYCLFFYLGAGTIPYVLLAECFIPEVQALASMLLIEWIWFTNFVIIAVFPFIMEFLGIHGTFYVFGIVAIVNASLGFFIVPETKGLSNEEIQQSFLRKRK